MEVVSYRICPQTRRICPTAEFCEGMTRGDVDLVHASGLQSYVEFKQVPEAVSDVLDHAVTGGCVLETASELDTLTVGVETDYVSGHIAELAVRNLLQKTGRLLTNDQCATH